MAVMSIRQTNWQTGSSRRNLATLTMSAAWAWTVSSPRVISWPVIESGSAFLMVWPILSSFSSIPAPLNVRSFRYGGSSSAAA